MARPSSKTRSLSVLIVVAMSMAGVQVTSAAAATDDPAGGTGRCAGAAIKMMVIAPVEVTGPVQSTPEVFSGAKAAEKAVNKKCEAGQPLEVITCDSHNTPEGDQGCARRAVDENVAAISSFATYGNLIVPIIEAAGIPDVGGNMVDPATQGFSDMVFGALPAPALVFGIPFVTVSVGNKNLAAMYLDVPSTQGLLALLPPLEKQAGFTLVDSIPVSPDQIDMSSPVAQALDKGADAILPAINGVQLAGVAKSIVQQGKTLEDIAVASSGSGLRPKEVQAIGSAANGFLLTSTFAPVTDKSNAGVAAYFKELKGAKQPTKDASEVGLQYWSAVHYIAGFMKVAQTKDAAGLLGVLNSPQGVVDRPEMAPTDFSKHAFEPCPTADTCGPNQNSTLSALRIFQNEFMVTRVVDGKQAVISDGFVPMLEEFEPKEVE